MACDVTRISTTTNIEAGCMIYVMAKQCYGHINFSNNVFLVIIFV